MDELMLLTDGSVNTKSNIGYGAYLVVSEHEPCIGFFEDASESEAI